MTISTETTTVDVNGSPMGLFIARPESGRAPALVVLQEAFGVNDHIKDIARRLAQQGYIAVAPELFHRSAPPGYVAGYTDWDTVREHLQSATPEAIEADIRATYDWLARDHQTDHSRVGAIGFCMGGRASFIANAKLPLSCAVSFYGGGIAPGLLHLAGDQQSPIAFFWGGLDKNLTLEIRTQIEQAMIAVGKKYVNVVFSDADHAFLRDVGHSYNPTAAREAWALTLSFLATNLKP